MKGWHYSNNPALSSAPTTRMKPIISKEDCVFDLELELPFEVLLLEDDLELRLELEEELLLLDDFVAESLDEVVCLFDDETVPPLPVVTPPTFIFPCDESECRDRNLSLIYSWPTVAASQPVERVSK